jgi:hypothetical protein
MSLSWVLPFLFLAPASDRPVLVKGRLELLGAPSDLPSALSKLAATSEDPTWAGYAVPMVGGSHRLCGLEDDVVRLDDDLREETGAEEPRTGELFVLYRLEGGRITKVRAVSSRCRIDAGAGALHWWEPVPAAESLARLESLASTSNGETLAGEAIEALALHRDPGADGSLGRIAAEGASFGGRKNALFWLGAVRGEGGFPVLAARLAAESDRKLREQIVFALNVSSAARATEKLIEIARSDGDSRIRESALFWLSQKAGKRAADAIASAVTADPELDVKKKAVFALSQLPPEEGVPLLLEVAETHPSLEVRKQAFFWLGQSHDPRALALFERVLRKK